ncbi:MAG TPA: response regulator transcription factor [Stellaceae bacterium]|nr:response regulator transcription factor [Stellaceae bacterium]
MGVSASDQSETRSRDVSLLRLLLVPEEGFLCEALAATIQRDESVAVVQRVNAAETIALSLAVHADAVLVLAPMEDASVVRRLSRVAPGVPIIACALAETEDNVIAWAKAGVTGYIPSATSLSRFVGNLRQILDGEQPSSPRIVAGLLNRFAAAVPLGAVPTRPQHQLTRRERQIAELIAAERSDKEIARLLNISVATTKFHVHNLLRKVNVQHRNQVVDALPWRGEHHRLGTAGTPAVGRAALSEAAGASC